MSSKDRYSASTLGSADVDIPPLSCLTQGSRDEDEIFGTSSLELGACLLRGVAGLTEAASSTMRFFLFLLMAVKFPRQRLSNDDGSRHRKLPSRSFCMTAPVRRSKYSSRNRESGVHFWVKL